jgi:hypothetical protein
LVTRAPPGAGASYPSCLAAYPPGFLPHVFASPSALPARVKIPAFEISWFRSALRFHESSLNGVRVWIGNVIVRNAPDQIEPLTIRIIDDIAAALSRTKYIGPL